MAARQVSNYGRRKNQDSEAGGQSWAGTAHRLGDFDVTASGIPASFGSNQ
jgi:hypothetical protein